VEPEGWSPTVPCFCAGVSKGPLKGVPPSVQPQVPRQAAFLASREPTVLTRVHHHPRHALCPAATCPEAPRHHACSRTLLGLTTIGSRMSCMHESRHCTIGTKAKKACFPQPSVPVVTTKSAPTQQAHSTGKGQPYNVCD